MHVGKYYGHIFSRYDKWYHFDLSASWQHNQVSDQIENQSLVSLSKVMYFILYRNNEHEFGNQRRQSKLNNTFRINVLMNV